MKKMVVLLAVFMSLILSQGAVKAEEDAGPQKKAGSELEELKARVEDIEKKMKETEIVDELGHKLHPIHSIYGLKISGGVTATAQGVTHIKGESGHRGAFALSADLALESPVGKDGRAVAVLDFQRGEGLKNVSSLLFTSPNGNPTGPNNDIESFNNDQIHVAQFYYEHSIAPNLIVTVGQLDPTAYFDTNEFANNERVQFLANEFANNTAIEFGGTENFYTPGLRVTYWPVENIDITLGAFDNTGEYRDSFDSPFLIGEFNLKAEPFGKKGNYRIYYWDRPNRPDAAATANPGDPTLLKAENSGVGVSIDQTVTDALGFWIRAGEQRKKVARFDRHISAGLNLSGGAFSRSDDVVGLGYGCTLMGKDFKEFKKSASPGFNSGAEHHIELYYSFAVNGATKYTGLHISPDVQYVINPGGDKDASKLFIYGVRMQAFF